MSNQDNPLGLGATGEFPRGKHRPDDLGELKTAITVDRTTNTVFIDFGKSIQWLALSVEQAENLAVVLVGMAKRARG